MLYIDWISTPNHKNFNRAFLDIIFKKDDKCVVFNKDLIIDGISCKFINSSEKRISRFFEILKILWEDSDNQVIFISYDPLFLPLVSLFKKIIIVYEHNTTPETGAYKHYLWQKIFFRKIYRMAQFPAQYNRLKEIGRKVSYIGSPLSKPVNILSTQDNSYNRLFAAPGIQADIKILSKFNKILSNSVLLVKNHPRVISQITDAVSVKIIPLDRIEFDHDGETVDAFFVKVKSNVRGSGWFNDAIVNNIPIIICDDITRQVLTETFPEYPFVDLNLVKNEDDLAACITEIKKFDGAKYIKDHNNVLHDRYIAMYKRFNIKNSNVG